MSTGGNELQDVTVNPLTNQVFVVSPNTNTIVVVNTTRTASVPLTTTITPSNFSNNTTTTHTPTFNLTANTTSAPAPRNIYYQLDTTQGEWRHATPTGSTATTLAASATAPFLYNGLHTIYYFTADSTSSTSINPLRAEQEESTKSDFIFDSFNAPEASQITGQIGSYQFLVSAPTITTAATVIVSGRGLTAKGKGIRNARVTLTDSNGNSRTTLTGAAGFYKFADLAAGATYIISVAAKRYTFVQSTQVSSVNENLEGVDFIAGN